MNGSEPNPWHEEQPLKEGKQMNITILSVQSTTQTSKAGKPYQQLEVAFKNNTFGKVESKKLMPFGAQKASFDALANAAVGSVFEVTVVKNDAGYNDWTTCTQAAPGAVTGAGSINNATKPTAGTTMQVKSTYETPEERAKKQVYIIRQSSISAAIASLSVGAKSALKPEDVLDLAEDYFTWVMQSPQDVAKQDIFDMPNDNDEVM
jgi:hypothetical protein